MDGYFTGLMSGTSLDAIDVAIIKADGNSVSLHSHFSQPIPANLRDALLSLCAGGNENELALMADCDIRLGREFATATLNAIERAGLAPGDIIATGSHGQTIRHHPQPKPGWTVQIGDPNTIAELTGITTVADFRRRDMAAGGEGAPLVPAFHKAIFSSPEQNRVIVNIGGMANITCLPANGSVTGFDTGPGNILLDSWIQARRQHTCDHEGEWAASGSIRQDLLDTLLDDDYFRLPPPKSTGRELFNLGWLQHHLQSFDIEAADVQATLTELTAVSIAAAIHEYAAGTERVLVCGGGVHNKHLLQRLAAALTDIQVSGTDAIGMDPDWVEAAAFAWLARQTLLHKPGNVAAVTGASHDAVLGGIYPA